jgi:hypothetical protein
VGTIVDTSQDLFMFADTTEDREIILEGLGIAIH